MDDHYELQVLIHTDENGYWATVAELPGIHAAGRTYEELIESLDEAIRLYLEETGIPADLAEQRVRVQKFNLSAAGIAPA